MLKDMRLKAGFSLFEILLALFVISVLVVGVTRYIMTQEQTSAEQQYGQNLYTYGQAVYQYVYNNSAYLIKNNAFSNPALAPASASTNGSLPAGYNMQVVIPAAQITQWLNQTNAGLNPQTGQPYLPAQFHLNQGVTQLLLALPDNSGSGPDQTKTGDASLSTTVYYSSTSTNLPPLIVITTGVLYQAQGSSQAYVLRPDLTAAAIQYANNFYANNQGGAAITYTYPYNPSSPSPTTVVTGNVTLGAQLGGGNGYLMTKGSNQGGNSMEGNINFGLDAQGNSLGSIQSVQVINFNVEPWGGGQQNVINNLSTLQLAQNGASLPAITLDPTFGGVIYNATTVNMFTGGVINNLGTLQFNSNSAAGQNQVQSLDSLVFRDATVSNFNGIFLSPITTCTYQLQPCNTGVPVHDSQNRPISLCFMTQFESAVPEKSAPIIGSSLGLDACIIRPKGNTWVLDTSSSGWPVKCATRCIQWSN